MPRLASRIDQGTKLTPQSASARCKALVTLHAVDGKNGCHLRPDYQPMPLEARVPARQSN